jgi:hypothetical protein
MHCCENGRSLCGELIAISPKIGSGSKSSAVESITRYHASKTIFSVRISSQLRHLRDIFWLELEWMPSREVGRSSSVGNTT